MFYSQVLEICRVDNKCAKCERAFVKWSDYHTHVTTVSCIKPVPMFCSGKRNITGVKQPLTDERKTQVVAMWESNEKDIRFNVR